VDYDSAVLERVSQMFRSEMWRCVVPDAVAEARIESARFGPVQATAYGDMPQVGALNQIQGAAEPGAVDGGYLAQAVEWMRAREVDYRVPVAEGRPGSAEAQGWLRERRYEPGDTWIKLVRDTSAPFPPEDPGVEIFELGEEEADGEGLSSILAEVFDMPVALAALVFSLPMEDHWRCYTAAARPEEEIVAAASMLIHEGVAQLGPGGTLAHARNRGCNRALIRRRLIDAAEAGCHTAFVELGERDPELVLVAYTNLLRVGFKEAYRSRNWQRPALRPAAVR